MGPGKAALLALVLLCALLGPACAQDSQQAPVTGRGEDSDTAGQVGLAQLPCHVHVLACRLSEQPNAHDPRWVSRCCRDRTAPQEARREARRCARSS